MRLERWRACFGQRRALEGLWRQPASWHRTWLLVNFYDYPRGVVAMLT